MRLILLLCVCIIHASMGKSVDDIWDVIVVGAGASGLGAASTLSQNGYKVLILEAGNRLGGRVNTQQMSTYNLPKPDGCDIIELGAEWIHGVEGNAVYETARKHNTTLDLLDWQMVYLSSNSKDAPSVDEIKAFGKFLDELQESIPSGPDNETIGEYTTKKFWEYAKNTSVCSESEERMNWCNGFLHAQDLRTKVSDASESWDNINIAAWKTFIDTPGEENWSWHKLGYSTLFKLILSDDDKVQKEFNETVTQILWDNNTVFVDTANGKQYRAKHVIVTVSLGVLKDTYQKLFKPALPAEKSQAIDSLSFGTVGKIVLVYETSWLNETNGFEFIWSANQLKKLDGDDDWWIREVAGGSIPRGCPKALTLWLAGEAARHAETLPLDTLKNKTRSFLEVFFPNTQIPEPQLILRSQWHLDPLFRGSYSYRGGYSADWEALVENIRKPLISSNETPRVLFAGETTHSTHYSTVHGALESGRREAQRLIKFFNGVKTK